MAKENKKPENKRPKFNAYWIYAAIILIFLGIQFFGGSSLTQPAKTTLADFKGYLRNGDVEKIEVVNKKIAKVYLTQEARKKEVHASKTSESFPSSSFS